LTHLNAVQPNIVYRNRRHPGDARRHQPVQSFWNWAAPGDIGTYL